MKKIYYRVKYRKSLIISENVQLDYATRILIKNRSKIFIDKNAYLRSKKYDNHSALYFPCTLFADGNKSSINIGLNTKLGGCYIHSQKEISIGKNCLIANGVNILDSNGHELLSENRLLERDVPEKIIIKDNVWVGINTLILKNTIIGENSVIGANSVVRGKFPKNSIIVGNPAIIVASLNL